MMAQLLLFMQMSNAETTAYAVDFLSNGFKHQNTNTNVNSTYTYVYMALQLSLVGANNIPATAR